MTILFLIFINTISNVMSLGKSIDCSLEPGEEIRFKQRNKTLMQKLATLTHFNYDEIEYLCVIYFKLQMLGEGKKTPIRRSQMKDVLHNALNMTEHKLMNCIMGTIDRSLTPYVSMESWIKIMSLYLRGTLEEKIQYCYTVYRKLGLSEKLNRNHIINLLHDCLKKVNYDDDEEGVKDLVDMLMKKMDVDRDGWISFDDYRTTVLNYPILLESFGRVLPDRLAIYAFETTFMKKVKKF